MVFATLLFIVESKNAFILKSVTCHIFTILILFQDCINFYKALPEKIRYGMYEIRNLNFNHYDFLFGRNSKTLVTDKLLEVLNKYVNENRNRV